MSAVRAVFLDWFAAAKSRLERQDQFLFWGSMAFICLGYVLLTQFARRVLARSPTTLEPSRFVKILGAWRVTLLIAVPPIAAVFLAWPRLSGFPCNGRFRYANLNLPSNMIANCAFAMAHSRGGILHSFWARFNTRKRSFSALSSVGKWPRARIALRNLAFNDLDCVCRIDDPTHFVGKGVERDDLAPMASPGLGDCRVLFGPMGLRRRRSVLPLRRRRPWPGRSVHAAATALRSL